MPPTAAGLALWILEAVRRCRGAWDPTWKRRCPARGPPVRAGPAAEPGDQGESGPALADYAVDPPRAGGD